MKNTPAWMPFYGDDFLGSTPTLTGAESFAHLAWIWQAFKRDGRLPNDDRKLRMWARADWRNWHRLKANVITDGHWTLSDCGTFFTHSRVTAEVERADKIRERARLNGSRSKGRPPIQPELPLAAEGQKQAPGARRLGTGAWRLAPNAEKPNKNNGATNQGGLSPEGAKKPRHNPTHSSQLTERERESSSLSLSINNPLGSLREPPPPEGGVPHGETRGPSEMERGGRKPRPVATSLPDGWAPTKIHYDLAAEKGQAPDWVNEQADLMRARAAANGRKRKTNWDAEFERQIRERLIAHHKTTGKTVAVTPNRGFHGFSSVIHRGLDHDEQRTVRVPGEPDLLPPLSAESRAGDPARDPDKPRRPDHDPVDVQSTRRAHARRP